MTFRFFLCFVVCLFLYYIYVYIYIYEPRSIYIYIYIGVCVFSCMRFLRLGVVVFSEPANHMCVLVHDLLILFMSLIICYVFMLSSLVVTERIMENNGNNIIDKNNETKYKRNHTLKTQL